MAKIDLFMEKVEMEPTSGCWLWTAAVHGSGYGHVRHNKRVEYAHRVSWELHCGPIPPAMNVLHKCDNPPCVNPRHLYIGTDKENAADRERRHRRRIIRGSAHGMSKLNEAAVREARLAAAGGESAASIGRRLGVTGIAVSYAVARKTWRHVA